MVTDQRVRWMIKEKNACVESKKTSILSALQNFKSKENAVEVKKQKEVVL